MMSSSLSRLITERIRKTGPITFRDFMEAALYEPGLGYYSSGKHQIGRGGDFYTGPSSTPLFGRLLAVWLQKELSEQPGPPYRIAEFGAAGGVLAADIKDTLAAQTPLFSENLEYITVDIGDSKPEPPLACVISNELVDAFPVHRIRMTKNGLRELYIDLNEDGFIEIERAPSTDSLQAYLAYLGVQLPAGFTTEINLDAATWLSDMAGLLAPGGQLLTIDYGYESQELYAPYRAKGTLIGYHKHEYSEDSFAYIGEQDLTSHVNFSALMKYGEEAGLETVSYSTQSDFLAELGAMKLLEELQRDSIADTSALKSYLALKDLVMPDGMGGVFKVLIQKKK